MDLAFKVKSGWRVMKTVHNRIGVERLMYHEGDDKWAVALENRTYHSFFEIPISRLPAWKKVFKL